MKFACRIACLFLLVVHHGAVAGSWIWFEAEDPSETNFPSRGHFEPSTLERPQQLSQSDWLSAGAKRKGDELFAQYGITIPQAGEYQLWARKFWKHGPFRWRIDSGQWQTCPRDAGLADDVFLAPNISANWVNAGQATIDAGPHIFELRLLAEQRQPTTAAFDCFLLTSDTFIPRGKLKPGDKSGLAEEGCFPFEPDVDRFEHSPIDLRRLNENVAGQSGFLQRRGDELTLADGTPARFWAVNIGPNNVALDHASIDYMARKLAKLGVNMVRFHGQLFDNDNLNRLNAATLDGLFYTVAAMKRQGIYTKLSFYFPVWAKMGDAYGIDGYEDFSNKQPYGLLFFNPRFQEIHRQWAKELLTTNNPYTQLSLARDPAVGIVEIINEDSLFFWTLSTKKVPPVQWRNLERMFSDWLIAKYGSVGGATKAWDKEAVAGDDIAASHAALLEAAHMTAKVLDRASDDKRRRVGDQVQFLAELQRNFYAEAARYIKDDLKFGGLVSAGNWTVSDPRLLGSIERWTYTAGDVIDRHGYFEPRHEGDGAAWSVRAGHTFEARAGVKHPPRVPLAFMQVQGFPQIISELGWSNPNRFRADAAFLCSAYGSLQGIDGMFLFAMESNFLQDTSLSKFSVSSPVMSGAFPAAALQYRRGDVKTAEPMSIESLDLRDLFAMKGTQASSEGALDQFRAKDVPPGEAVQGLPTGFDPLSFFVGPMFQNFDARPGASMQRNPQSFIDRENKTIRSLTGELNWNYDKGIATINTPRSQGAAGFLAIAGEIELADVRIRCNNEFAAISVISLDGLALSESKQILIQAITEENPFGFKTESDRIVDLGSFPFGIRRIDATVSFKSTGGATVQTLDPNGCIRSSAQLDTQQIPLPPDALYAVIQR